MRTVRVPGFAATCPDCGDVAHPTATVCESCGTHLYVQAPSGTPFTTEGPHGCTCGDNGTCLACLFAEYEGEHRNG